MLCGPIILNIGFGFYPVVVKYFANQGENRANAYVFTFYRDLGAVPVLFSFSILIEGKLPVPNLRMALNFVLFGFFGMFFGQFAFITGVYLVGPSVSSALQPLIVVWTVIVSIMCCTEKVPSLTMLHTWAKFGGILSAIAGAMELILGGYEHDATLDAKAHTNSIDDTSSNEVNPHLKALGYFALIIDTVAAAIYYTLQKKVIFMAPACKWKDYPIAVTGYAYLFGSLFMGSFTLYYIWSGQPEQFIIPQHSLYALAYAVFITSAFCYFLITWSNKYLPSSIMTAFWPMQVLVSVITAYIVFGDKLSSRQCIGAFLVLVGLVLVVYSNRVEEKLASSHKDGNSTTALTER